MKREKEAACRKIQRFRLHPPATPQPKPLRQGAPFLTLFLTFQVPSCHACPVHPPHDEPCPHPDPAVLQMLPFLTQTQPQARLTQGFTPKHPAPPSPSAPAPQAQPGLGSPAWCQGPPPAERLEVLAPLVPWPRGGLQPGGDVAEGGRG